MTESLVLALGGGIAGLALAIAGTRALVALAPGDLPLVHAVHVDGVVLSFSLVVTLLSGVVFGVVPALQGSRQGIEARLRAGSRGLSLGSGRLRRVLVMAEVALAMTLLAGAGLLVRSLARLTAVDPDFRADHVTTFSLTLSPVRYPEAARQEQFDAELPVYDARSYDDIVRESIAERRFYVTLLAMFAALALGLAAVGIYGVIAYSVQQRRRELGIRIALGASRERVIGLVVRQGMALTIIGAAVGLVVAALLTRVLRGQLYEVSATDPLTFAAVPGILVVVALVACVVPARRAVAVDPAKTIRAES